MKTLILHHDDCLKHDPGFRHPERADRVRAVLSAVRNVQGTELLPAPLASQEQVCRAHDPNYWQKLIELEPEKDSVMLDPDTFLSAGSINAALHGSGAACFAIDQVFSGKSRNAFCAVRPPGHHAENAIAMGFCLLNHVAVAARHALAVHGISHQMPLYPGTGHPDEIGVGNILNLPLAPGSGSPEFRAAWSTLGLPALHGFQPGLIIISAGFDAHQSDPLGQLELQDDDYGWITAEICRFAHEACGDRVISVLEGGYDLDALASASLAHVEALTS
jgi:acetoin utilization deacetylase AcuC-like enzyme